MDNKDIIARLEALEINYQQLNVTVAELTNIMRYQMQQAAQDREQAVADRHQAEIDRNTFIDAISENSEDIEQLTERFNQFIEQAAADRQQAALDRQEIRRIWEYLLTQSSNGHNPTS